MSDVISYDFTNEKKLLDCLNEKKIKTIVRFIHEFRNLIKTYCGKTNQNNLSDIHLQIFTKMLETYSIDKDYFFEIKCQGCDCDYFEVTSLLYLFYDYPQIIKFLLESGADPNKILIDSDSVFDKISKEIITFIEFYMDPVPIEKYTISLKLFLQHNAKIKKDILITFLRIFKDLSEKCKGFEIKNNISVEKDEEEDEDEKNSREYVLKSFELIGEFVLLLVINFKKQNPSDIQIRKKNMFTHMIFDLDSTSIKKFMDLNKENLDHIDFTIDFSLFLKVNDNESQLEIDYHCKYFSDLL